MSSFFKRKKALESSHRQLSNAVFRLKKDDKSYFEVRIKSSTLNYEEIMNGAKIMNDCCQDVKSSTSKRIFYTSKYKISTSKYKSSTSKYKSSTSR